ncbi:2-C-methyl-D-erythritol 4-phosphate cytidylyltransferase [Paraglaciecola sp. L3A3]|uniref:2-C-methyl-D-erythritol 4-phosphate cytidylyltransferase n=1 Tax=Paraglaciecola sp. L3A3 TaxID=2686358 RepID=UPI00131B2732|nr:2-C-methyl-D-erythritol 4-phosphate cytidylyltransferase [Paraglaciecola sp. L3A3]
MSFIPQYSIIIPAAGIGKRMQSVVPKQYLLLAGKTIIEQTISGLLAHPQIKRVVIVLSAKDETFHTLPVANDPRVETTIGGKERSDSVLAGLHYLSNSHEKWVLVHDAARPCLLHKDLTRLLRLAEKSDLGGILATPVRDTMKRANANNLVAHTEPRENLWHALTPQFFMLEQLRNALIKAAENNIVITDEASAIEYVQQGVHIVEGCASNIKVTKPEDLLLAEFYLTQRTLSHKDKK